MTFDDRVTLIKQTGKSVPTCEIRAFVNLSSKDLEIHKIETMTISRNYLKDYGDVVVLEGHMPLGNFVKFVFPERKGLTVTIIEKRGKLTFKNKYLAILLNGEENSENNLFKNATTESLNVETAYLKFQLISVHLEFMMESRTTGIVENRTVLEVMTTIIKSEWLKDPNQDMYTKEISIIPPHNTNVQKQFVFPSFMKTVDIPTFIQKNYHGVYNGDIGLYIQKILIPVVDKNPTLEIDSKFRNVWIYPLINETPTNRKFRKLKIFVAGEYKANASEKTFRLEGNSIEIIATTKDVLDLVSVISKVSKKTVVAEYDIKNMVNRTYRTDLVNTIEVNGDLSTVREDTHAIGEITDEGITANSFKTKTNEMLLNRKVISVDWNKSVPDLLFPGMQVDLFIKDEGVTKTIKGILSGTYTIIDNVQTVSISKLFITLKP